MHKKRYWSFCSGRAHTSLTECGRMHHDGTGGDHEACSGRHQRPEPAIPGRSGPGQMD